MSAPSPEGMQAALDAAFLKDLAAVCAIHGRIFDAWMDADTPVVLFRDAIREPTWNVLVMFEDGEVRFEPEIRAPEEVQAQAIIPKSAHARLAAAKRVASLSEKKDGEDGL